MSPFREGVTPWRGILEYIFIKKTLFPLIFDKESALKIIRTYSESPCIYN